MRKRDVPLGNGSSLFSFVPMPLLDQSFFLFSFDLLSSWIIKSFTRKECSFLERILLCFGMNFIVGNACTRRPLPRKWFFFWKERCFCIYSWNRVSMWASRGSFSSRLAFSSFKCCRKASARSVKLMVLVVRSSLREV